MGPGAQLLPVMDQPKVQSRFVRISLKIARFIGIYVLAVAIVLFLSKKELFANIKINPVIILLYFFVALPLVWALSKNFLAGLVRYALLIGLGLLINQLSPTDNANASNDSSADSFNYVGNYAADENGVQVKMIVSTNKWYGEAIEGTTGGLISSESGDVIDKALYDQYGTEIGQIRNGEIRVTIQGQYIRLKKD